MKNFKISSKYSLMGDQVNAVQQLVESVNSGNMYQTLKGVTGSGKTFCMANIIEQVNKPTLIISHNKILAAQLYSEFKDLFPNNAVEYFVSHYKHYQPECYLPIEDKYIEKETVINDDIERMRQHCMQSLLTRSDVIVVASVSAIFGLGDPNEFRDNMFTISVRDIINRDELLLKLIKHQYERNDLILSPGSFRVRGDIIDIMLSTDDKCFYRIYMFDDDVEAIKKLSLNDEVVEDVLKLDIFNVSSYIVNSSRLETICDNIKEELNQVYNDFISRNEFEYATRIKGRTNFDIEMIREIGYCKGLESYQRYLSNREPGSPPCTLLDFFPSNYLMFVDESHVTLPQLRSIGNQNSTIKHNLIKYGFRLPSCIDNRPLTYSEFESKINQVIYVSATPTDYELMKSNVIAEQLIRPTGVIDPEIVIKPIEHQIDSIIEIINTTIINHGSTLVSTLTKRMSEDLCEYLASNTNIRACYVHSGLSVIDRVDRINDLQNGNYDVLIGCNLLREGLSIHNCQRVLILDADKEGFLRNKTTLLQLAGRAARNINGKVIMFADKISDSMREAIDETNKHRKIQIEHNKRNNIIPQSVDKKLIKNVVGIHQESVNEFNEYDSTKLNKLYNEYNKCMEFAAINLDFEEAIKYRDLIEKIKSSINWKKSK